MPSGYERTEVGVIPRDWEIKRLGNHVTFLRHGVNSRAELTRDGSVKYLHYGDIHTTADVYLEPPTREMPTLHSDRAKTLDRLQNGDLVLVDASEDLEGVGKSVEIKGIKSDEVVAGLHTITARFDKAVLADGFKAYLQFCPAFRHHLRRHAAGTKVYATNRAHIASVQIPLPSVREQRAIAEALSDVDGLLRALGALIAKKWAIKLAAMQQLLTGKNRLPEFSGQWETKRLGDTSAIWSGATPSTQVAAYWNGDIPWCTPTDITGAQGKYLLATERRITAEGLASCAAKLLPPGTLLLCSRATIGEVKIALWLVCTNQGFKSLVCRAGVSNEFIYYLLLTLRPQMIERAIGSTFLEIGKRDVASIQIRMPSHDEQQAIAAVLADMDAEIAALERRHEKTRAIKQGMMQQLLTGRVRLVKLQLTETSP